MKDRLKEANQQASMWILNSRNFRSIFFSEFYFFSYNSRNPIVSSSKSPIIMNASYLL